MKSSATMLWKPQKRCPFIGVGNMHHKIIANKLNSCKSFTVYSQM